MKEILSLYGTRKDETSMKNDEQGDGETSMVCLHIEVLKIVVEPFR